MATNKQTVLSATCDGHMTRVMPDVISTIIHDFIRPNPQKTHRYNMRSSREALATIATFEKRDPAECPSIFIEVLLPDGSKSLFNCNTISVTMLDGIFYSKLHATPRAYCQRLTQVVAEQDED